MKKICSCKKEHLDTVKFIEVGKNALDNLPGIVEKGGFHRILLVSDLNTVPLAVPKIAEMLFYYAPRIFTFQTAQLTPDEAAVDALMAQAEQMDLIIAVGSGTINDLSRYVSFTLGIPYIIVCSAPSMDGYASGVSALIVDGFKKTVETAVPYAIIGDLSILKTAPLPMIQAGFGDLAGKYSCLMDWKMSALFHGEYYCDMVAAMTLESVEKASASLDAIAKQEDSGIENLYNSLILSGVAMSYVGNSRPASGAEHHISHYWEMAFLAEKREPVLHGIKVGIATLAILKLYAYLQEEIIDWATLKQKQLLRYADENLRIRLNAYEKNWEVFLEKVKNELPSYEQVRFMLETLQHPIHPKEIDISRQLFKDGILHAKEIRPRFTLLQLLHDVDLLEQFAQRATQYYYGE